MAAPSEEGSSKFCSKCGAPVSPSAAFCSSCGATTGSSSSTTSIASQKMYWKEYRFARRKGDKLGPLIGGLIVIWLGVTLYLALLPSVRSAWWAYFFIGVGVILIGSGVYRWKQYAYRYPPAGYLVGGLFLLIIGLAGVVQASLFGPGLLIAIGVVIIVLGVYAVRPKSSAAAPKTTAEPSST